jgi:hypothetical protein
MADISVTAANVIPATTARVRSGLAGATITAGQPLFEDSSDGHALKPAQANTAARANAVGIALGGASDGQIVNYITEGDLTAGATLTVGIVYCVSDAAAGGIAPYADLASGDFVTVLGIARTAAILDVDIQASGIAKP